MRWSILSAAIALLCVACHNPDLDQKIAGEWESAGTPASMALPENVRRSASWSAAIEFEPDNTFAWRVDNGTGGNDLWTGSYSVVGYSFSIHVTGLNGKELRPDEQLKYTVRQQATGSIRLPLPQDWTGPSVDYFPKD